MSDSSFTGYDSIFADRLRKEFNEKKVTQNVTQSTLASVLGVTRQAISSYLNGETIPTADKLKKIADYFDVPADYLIGRTNDPTTDKDLQYIVDYTGLSSQAILALHNAEDETGTNAIPLILDHFLLSDKLYQVFLRIFWGSINAQKLQDQFDNYKDINDLELKEQISIRHQYLDIKLSLYEAKECFSRFVDSYFKGSSGFDLEQWEKRLYDFSEKEG